MNSQLMRRIFLLVFATGLSQSPPQKNLWVKSG